MNWGYKIMLVYAIFVGGIVLLVAKSCNQNQDLVTEDYYEQELKYQDKIDMTIKANELSSPLKYSVQQRELSIEFPVEMDKKAKNTQVLIYCIADKTKDFQRSITTEGREVAIPLPEKNKGYHDIKVTWETGGIKYYNEHKILIP